MTAVTSGALALLVAPSLALAQVALPPTLLTAPAFFGAPPPETSATPEPAAPEGPPRVAVSFNAIFAPGDIQAIRSGLHWRVFDARAGEDGNHALVAESSDATPTFELPDGDYIVHAACGLAGADRQIAVNGAPLSERLVMNAGALKIEGRLGEVPIPASRLNILVYLPEREDPEAKLIIPNLKAGAPECLPEGAYHIVSHLMDVTPASTNPTNSTVYADLRVQAGKLTDGVLKHRAANMTLKLVNTLGGEALANTSFSILTPGGDVIREMIGAFPSLVLAEGEYVAIARHDNKTYQSTFKVLSNQDRDIEVLAQQPTQ
ncbi:MAG TPA: hypothetical protein VMU18_09715 [Rhodoblastus sp.]|nr:hypothetical protein [Rhodoblastus sp.]